MNDTEPYSKEVYIQTIVARIIGKILESARNGEQSYTHIFPETTRFYEEIVESIRHRCMNCTIVTHDRTRRARFITGRVLQITWE
jgi:hypothetical protein